MLSEKYLLFLKNKYQHIKLVATAIARPSIIPAIPSTSKNIFNKKEVRHATIVTEKYFISLPKNSVILYSLK